MKTLKIRSSTPPSASPAAKRWLTIEATADKVGVATRTVRRWVADGTLPAYRLGDRLIRIDEDDVDAMLHRIPTKD